MEAKKKAQKARKKRNPTPKGKVPHHRIGGKTFGDTVYWIDDNPVWAVDKKHAIAKYKKWKEQQAA